MRIVVLARTVPTTITTQLAGVDARRRLYKVLQCATKTSRLSRNRTQLNDLTSAHRNLLQSCRCESDLCFSRKRF